MPADKRVRPPVPRGEGPAPLYKRLPSGPHRLPRRQVLRHQRVRIQGAMVEAVAASGYQRTSVRQVIALAGVSRRSFYEHFSNREECLLETFDLLARQALQRAEPAHLSSGASLQERLRALFGECAEAIATNPKAASLLLLETQTAGTPGLMRQRRMTASCEQILCRSFGESPGESPLPIGVVRGIAGGLYAVMSTRLREQPDGRVGELGEEMLAWTLLFPAPGTEAMGQLIATRAARMMRGRGRPGPAREVRPVEERSSLMESALRLGADGDLRELHPPRIAEEASVSVDAFFELFSDGEDCYLAALDMLAAELLTLVAEAAPRPEDWTRFVRRAIGELMGHLAERPHRARTIAAGAFAAGPRALARNLELSRELAGLLLAGAPGDSPGAITVEAVGGAIWHTVRCQVCSGHMQLLPALADHLSYVVLAPVIGAGAAVEALRLGSA
jgi:AcrR family transcriptional regulator